MSVPPVGRQRRTGPRAARRGLPAVLLVALLAGAGCGSSGGTSGGASSGAASPGGGGRTAPASGTVVSAGSAVRAAAGVAAATGAAGGGGATSRGGAGASVSAGDRLALGLRIAQTADLTVRVPRGRLDEAVDDAALEATRTGGYVVSSSSGDEAGGPATGSVVLRVPADRLAGVVRRLEGLGRVLTRRLGSEDLTQDYVDTRSRLRHLRRVEARLLAVLNRATRVGDILAIQGRLDDVQGAIELAKGRLDHLAGITDFATVSLQLQEPGAVVTRPRAAHAGFAAALRRSLHLAAVVAEEALVALGALLPPALAVALVALAVRLVRRRVRPARPVPPAPDGAA